MENMVLKMVKVVTQECRGRGNLTEMSGGCYEKKRSGQMMIL